MLQPPTESVLSQPAPPSPCNTNPLLDFLRMFSEPLLPGQPYKQFYPGTQCESKQGNSLPARCSLSSPALSIPFATDRNTIAAFHVAGFQVLFRAESPVAVKAAVVVVVVVDLDMDEKPVNGGSQVLPNYQSFGENSVHVHDHDQVHDDVHVHRPAAWSLRSPARKRAMGAKRTSVRIGTKAGQLQK
jgi:hypothetical protein